MIFKPWSTIISEANKHKFLQTSVNDFFAIIIFYALSLGVRIIQLEDLYVEYL